MIYKTLKKALESVPGLENSVFPPGVVLDDVPPPLAVYYRKEGTPSMSMSGRNSMENDVYSAMFFAKTYMEAQALYDAALKRLQALTRTKTESGENIILCRGRAVEEDGVIKELELAACKMEITIIWQKS